MRKSIENLRPYETPSGRGLPLHRNTNLWGTNPIAHDLPYWIEQIDLSNYPDASAKGLREELADFHNLRPENFLVGNGSNEVFDLIFKTFVNPGEAIAHPGPSYSMYKHYALANACDVLEFPLDNNFQFLAEPLSSIEAKLVVLCSPNNPTGNVFSSIEIEKALSTGKLVAIDEAYAEFSDQNWLSQINNHHNLLVTRTFSKAFGLAALRVGYVAAHPDLIELIDRVRLPYNVNALSQIIATMALRNRAFVDGYVNMIKSDRALWAEALEKRGFKVFPSDANFLLARVPENQDRNVLLQNMATKGVLLRATNQAELSQHVRITIGTPEDLAEMERALDEVLR